MTQYMIELMPLTNQNYYECINDENDFIKNKNLYKQDDYIKSFLPKTKQEIKKELDKIAAYCEDNKEHIKGLYKFYIEASPFEEDPDIEYEIKRLRKKIIKKEYIYNKLKKTLNSKN